VRIESAENRIGRLEDQVALWRAAHERQEEQLAALRLRLSEVETDYRRLAEQQAGAEQRLGRVAQLHAALRQLHESPLPGDVLTTIKEIVANLVGSEQMAIFARRADGTLKVLDGIGEPPESLSPRADEILAQVARTGELYLATPAEEDVALAVIPLRMGERVAGAIAVYRLLPQKPALEEVDRDLFELLATHAGLAFERAELRASLELEER